MCSQEEQKKQKKAQQVHQKAAERKEGIGAHLFIRSPSMSLVPQTQQNAMRERQTDSPSPSITDTIALSINDLCTQIENLTLDEQEEVINHLCIT